MSDNKQTAKKKCKEEFEWTDELVVEFTTWSLSSSPTMQGRYADIEQFKASKQRKCLLTTEDWKEIFEGDEFWTVDLLKFNIEKLVCDIQEDGSVASLQYFSTEAAAKQYVRLNKPLYSLNDINNAWRKFDGGYLDLINTLEKIKQ